jgi:methylated-DNA-[protein]-cysteine S-methyltransferase
MKFDPSLVYTESSSPLGAIWLAATDTGLAGMWFVGQRHAPDPWDWTRVDNSQQHPVLNTANHQLQAYFAGHLRRFDLPLDLRGGTPFQQSVWQALLRIPVGETTSYGEISRRIAKPLAIRAVGTAIGRNPISIIVPCHRVLGAGGALTGYAGGLDRKVALLQLESRS